MPRFPSNVLNHPPTASLFVAVAGLCAILAFTTPVWAEPQASNATAEYLDGGTEDPAAVGGTCSPPNCNGNGVCVSGVCACNVGFVGAGCEFCAPNYYNYPLCTFCQSSTTCNGNGTCSALGGCNCNTGFTGSNCQFCATNYYNYPTCTFCLASSTCSNNGVCTSSGACACNVGFVGVNCNQCGPNYYNYPTCTFCLASSTCNNNGSCSSLGGCNCDTGFTGANCQLCAPNYYNYPTCTFCQASTTCSGNGTCNSLGSCNCNAGWTGINCSIPALFPPAVAPVPHDRPKNRYVSFDPNNPGTVVAFRVQKTTLPIGSCWVQTPVQTGPDQYTAKCDTAPVYRVWTEPYVHVGDCEIIPVATYDVFTNAPGPVELPTPLTVSTIPLPALNGKLWGDAVGINNGTEWTAPNQLTNVQDVLGLLAYISNAPIQPQFTAANLQAVSSADSCLNAFVNTSDVLSAVGAVAGNSYGPPSTAKTIDPTTCPVCP